MKRHRRTDATTRSPASSPSRTTPRGPSASSTCSRAAGRPSRTCSTTSRCSNEKNGEDLPDHVRGGQRLTGMSRQPGVAPAGRLARSSSPSTASAARGSASCCRTPPASPTSCASSSRCTPRRSTTTRRSRSSRPARRSPAGRRIGSWLSYGLGSMNENLPAFVVLVTKGKGDQPLYARLWGNGFLDSPAPGRAVRRRQGPGALPHATPTASRRDGRRADARHAGRAQPRPGRARARPGDRLAHRAVRDGLPHADQRAGGDRLLAASRSTSSTCTAPTRRSRARSPPTACWPAGWPSAACGSSSSTTRAGTSTATCRAAIRTQASETDQPSRGAAHRPEAARPARRHAGHLGRRVRPHQLLPGQADGRPTTAATITRAASPIWMAGGGVQAGLHLRPDRRLRLQHRRRRRQPDQPDKHEFTPGAVHVHDLQATILHLLGIDHERLTSTSSRAATTA